MLLDLPHLSSRGDCATYTTPSPRKPEDVSPIFGLRYLEEESAEINGVNGCMIPVRTEPSLDEGDGRTYYVTNCDYTDYD